MVFCYIFSLIMYEINWSFVTLLMNRFDIHIILKVFFKYILTHIEMLINDLCRSDWNRRLEAGSDVWHSRYMLPSEVSINIIKMKVQITTSEKANNDIFTTDLFILADLRCTRRQDARVFNCSCHTQKV